MTDEECREAYRWVLAKLTETGASELAKDIEAAVLRGVIREEDVERKQTVSVRVPLTGRERLLEALRMLVATASVPAMIDRVRAQAVAAAAEGAGNAVAAASLKWVPDYVEQHEDSDGVKRADEAVQVSFPDGFGLEALANAIRACDAVIGELVAEEA